VLEPAEITVPPYVRKISLFPGGGLPQPVGVFDSLNDVRLAPGYNYNRIKRGYMEGVFSVLSTSPRYERVMLSDTQNISLIESGMIGWNDLSRICTHDSTQAILLLKRAVTRDFSLPQNCGALFVFVNNTKWTLYDPFQQSIVENIVLNDTNVFQVADVNCGTEISDEDLAGMLYDAVNTTGLEIGRRLCPTWQENVPRFLISGPETDMHLAAMNAINNDWNTAAVIWNRLVEEGDRKLASHASFNLAVAWERDDDLDQALSWISYADSLHSSPKTFRYKQIIADRLKKREILNYQMSLD
jgi:hypothetical protein